jgi:hypothetical protein
MKTKELSIDQNAYDTFGRLLAVVEAEEHKFPRPYRVSEVLLYFDLRPLKMFKKLIEAHSALQKKIAQRYNPGLAKWFDDQVTKILQSGEILKDGTHLTPEQYGFVMSATYRQKSALFAAKEGA